MISTSYEYDKVRYFTRLVTTNFPLTFTIPFILISCFSISGLICVFGVSRFSKDIRNLNIGKGRDRDILRSFTHIK